MAREVLTAQQERFAQLVVLHGKKQRIAYRKAYVTANMKDSTADEEASRLVRHPKVAARIAELRARMDAKLDVSIQDIARQMARMAFLDLRDCYDDNGMPLPPHELPENVALAITGYEIVPGKFGQRAKVTHDRSQGVALIAKFKKMLVDQVEQGAPGDFSKLSDDELEQQHRAFTEAVKVIDRWKKGPKPKVTKPAKA